MDEINNTFRGIAGFVKRMSASQVMMSLGITAGLIVGLVMAVGWLNNATYSPLYSGLDDAEAGEVVAYLTSNSIPHRLDQNGRTIEVASDQVYRVRLSLASEGLPRTGTVGYSIFDESQLGMTDFQQSLNFRRALEGELTRTIMQLREVQAARVHIVMPKQRLFKRDQKPATASVVLKLRGPSLSQSQIAGVTHLIASSVEGLNADNITLVDYDGNLLTSGFEQNQLAGLSSSQLNVRKQVEGYLQHKAQTMLDDVLGVDKAVIRVTADLNFDRLDRTSENYDRASPAVRSEEYTRSLKGPNDGSDWNYRNSDYGSETTVTNYELNKTVEHIVSAVGTINRLSIAVMVDGTYRTVTDENGAELVYQPRSQNELDKLAAIVGNAIGFDADRNDRIEMVNVPFDRKDLQDDRAALDSMYMQQYYRDIAGKVGLALLALIVLVWVRKSLGRFFASLGRIASSPPPVEEPLRHLHQGVTTRMPTSTANSTRKSPNLIDQMQKTASDKPDDLVSALKSMMTER